MHLKQLEVLPWSGGRLAHAETSNMKSWKVLFGVGGACAACCALPLVGGVAALSAGSSALLACADELAPIAWATAALAIVAGSVWWWRRRQARKSACGCGSTDGGTPHRCEIEGSTCK